MWHLLDPAIGRHDVLRIVVVPSVGGLVWMLLTFGLARFFPGPFDVGRYRWQPSLRRGTLTRYALLVAVGVGLDMVIGQHGAYGSVLHCLGYGLLICAPATWAYVVFGRWLFSRIGAPLLGQYVGLTTVGLGVGPIITKWMVRFW